MLKSFYSDLPQLVHDRFSFAGYISQTIQLTPGSMSSGTLSDLT